MSIGASRLAKAVSAVLNKDSYCGNLPICGGVLRQGQPICHLTGCLADPGVHRLSRFVNIGTLVDQCMQLFNIGSRRLCNNYSTRVACNYMIAYW
jgi:hypothetical protein